MLIKGGKIIAQAKQHWNLFILDQIISKTVIKLKNFIMAIKKKGLCISSTKIRKSTSSINALAILAMPM